MLTVANPETRISFVYRKAGAHALKDLANKMSEQRKLRATTLAYLVTDMVTRGHFEHKEAEGIVSKMNRARGSEKEIVMVVLSEIKNERAVKYLFERAGEGGEVGMHALELLGNLGKQNGKIEKAVLRLHNSTFFKKELPLSEALI